MTPKGYSPRKLIGMGQQVPWSEMDNLKPAPGAFGMSTTLGGKAAMPNADAGRRFPHMSDSERCCPPPISKGFGMANQANAIHVQKMPRQVTMPRGRPLKYKSALAYFSVENLLKRKGLEVKINRGKTVKAVATKEAKRKGSK